MGRIVRREPRADAGDMASWSAATLKEHARHLRHYNAVAERAGIDADKPSEHWVAEMIAQEFAKNGRGCARRFARHLGHHFRSLKGHDPTEGPQVRAVLAASDDVDPLSIDFQDAAVPIAPIRARAFADAEYNAETYRMYAKYAQRWRERCLQNGIDPLRPSEFEFERWLDELAFNKKYSTVLNTRNAIAHYFRKNKVPDVSRSAGVKRILEGLKRKKPPGEIRPVTAEERRRMLAANEMHGTWVRDRVIVLLTAFTRCTCEDIALIRVEQCRLSDKGVAIDRGGEIPVISIGTHPERDLDIVFWMRRLLDKLPPNGPLIRQLPGGCHDYAPDPVTPMLVHSIIQRVARDAKVSGKAIAKRLRMLFEMEISMAGVSEIVHAKAMGTRRLRTGVTEEARRRVLAIRAIRRASPLGAIQ